MDYRDRIDAVVAFVPKRAFSGKSSVDWDISIAARPDFDAPVEGLESIAAMLPKPRFEGYQARSLFRQGVFSFDRSGVYDGMKIIATKDAPLQVKIPARALLDLLAGRITIEHFHQDIGATHRDGNLFELWLQQGNCLKMTFLEDRGLDVDDDYVVLYLDNDPSASELKPGEASSNTLADS